MANSKKKTVPVRSGIGESEEPMREAECNEELKAVREQLADAQQKVKCLEDLPTPVMTIDNDFNITFMNPTGAGLAGKSPDQVIGMKCYDLFKTSHCHTEECRCQQAMKLDGVFTGETVADPNGLNMPIQYTSAPIKDGNGNIVGALEYVVDMTETRKAIDDANTKVEYLNRIPTPVVVIDKEYNVQFMNPAAAGAVGKNQEEVKGLKCFNLFNTTHCNTEECRCMQAMTKNGVFTGDTEANLPTGTLPIRYTGTPLKNENGHIIGALEYVIDITEENQAVAEVRSLVDAALEGILDQRGDPEKFTVAGFKNVIKGLNETLDAIVDPVNESINVMARLADNDLTFRVVGNYKGDLEKMKSAINSAIDALTGLIGQIRENADNLANASAQMASAANQAGQATQQVASTSQDMAKGAGAQAATAQETASSMQQLTTVIDQVARGSQEQAASISKASASVGEVSSSAEQMAQYAAAAADGSKLSAESAQNGAEKARQTVEGMQRIITTVNDASEKVTALGTQSEEIGKIVAVIDDIAAQTNLLALNAAIEAARAGEHGRGFAVVSDEVRKLAERTASATKEIADLIRNIQNGVAEAVKAMQEGTGEVQVGYKLATEAGEALEGILKAASDVNEQIEQISAGTQEVSASSAELVTIIDNVGSITEQNTAAAQQMSSTSEDVANAVENMAGIAEENSAATEQVSASAEQMGAQVQEIVASSQSLNEMAAALQEAVAIFKVAAEQSNE